jgi:UDP-glucose 4-epimerase
MHNQLRFGRGVDNRRFKAAGFRYGHTSRETVTTLGEHMRLHPLMRGAGEPYRYEREVEEFLRWSPHVKNARPDGSGLSRDQLAELQRALNELGSGDEPAEAPQAAEPEPPPPPQPRPRREPPAPPPRPGAPVDHYDDLESEEVISLLGSLEPGDLRVLRAYESDHAGRESVLRAIDSVLARSPDASGVAPGGSA